MSVNRSDRLSKVSQIVLFFSLVSSIALRMEQDTSSEALGYLLVFTLAVPPVAAFVYESDVLEASNGPLAAAARQRLSVLFDATLGGCLRKYLMDKDVA